MDVCAAGQLPRGCNLGSYAGKYSDKEELKQKAKNNMMKMESSGKTTKASQEKPLEKEQEESPHSQPSIQKNTEECRPNVESHVRTEKSAGTEDLEDGMSDRKILENEKAASQLDKPTKISAEKNKQELSLSRGEKDQSRSRLPGSHCHFSRLLCHCLDVAKETDVAAFEPAHRENDRKSEAYINDGNDRKEITGEPKMVMVMPAASSNDGTKSHTQSSPGPHGTRSDSSGESQASGQSSSVSSKDMQDSRKKKKKKQKEHRGVDSEPDKTQKHKHKNNMTEKSKEKDIDKKSDQKVQSSVMCKLKKWIRQMSRMFVKLCHKAWKLCKYLIG